MFHILILGLLLITSQLVKSDDGSTCVDIGKDCVHWARSVPERCQDKDWAANCAKTCGTCLSGTDPACPLEAPPANVTLLTTGETVKLGYAARYECKAGTHYVRGDTISYCSYGNKFDGVPLKCLAVEDIECEDKDGADDCYFKIWSHGMEICQHRYYGKRCRRTCGTCLTKPDDSCVDTGKDCIWDALYNPLKCRDKDYATNVCPKACGTCESKVTDSSCEVEPPSANVILLTTDKILKVGYSAKYRCKDGYRATAGWVRNKVCTRAGFRAPPLECGEKSEEE